MVSENCAHYKSMETFDTQGVASLDHRVFIARIDVGRPLDIAQHTKE